MLRICETQSLCTPMWSFHDAGIPGGGLERVWKGFGFENRRVTDAVIVKGHHQRLGSARGIPHWVVRVA